jgi:hypothetical protein
MNSIRKVFGMAAISGAFLFALMAMCTSTANADSVNWDAVAQCESGGDWSTNTGNGYYGGLQFKPSTWSSHGGVGNPATAPRTEQIRVAENVLTTQGIGAWPECGRYARTTFSAGSTTSSIPTIRRPSDYIRATISEIFALVPRPGR